VKRRYLLPKSTNWLLPSYSKIAGIACPLSNLIFSSVINRIMIFRSIESATKGYCPQIGPAQSAMPCNFSGSPGQRIIYVVSVNRTSREACWNASEGRTVTFPRKGSRNCVGLSLACKSSENGIPARKDSRSNSSGQTGHSVHYACKISSPLRFWYLEYEEDDRVIRKEGRWLEWRTLT
jgi:hypothetical protein